MDTRRVLIWAFGSLIVAGPVVVGLKDGANGQAQTTLPRSNHVQSTPPKDTGSAVDLIDSRVADSENTYKAMSVPPTRDGSGKLTLEMADRAGLPPQPHVDASGLHATLTADEIGLMRNHAHAKIYDLFTPDEARKVESIFEGAISIQSNGGTFVESAAGASVKSFTGVQIAGQAATVTAVVTQWDDVGQIQPDATIRWSHAEADIQISDTLILDGSGNWRISDRNWTYVPGQGL